MRILYLNPCGRLGGAETSLRELLASVRVAEPEWDLWLVLGEDGPLRNRAQELGIKVVVLPFPPSLARVGDTGQSLLASVGLLLKAACSTALYSRRLTRVVRSIRPHIVHTNGFKMHLLGAWTRPKEATLIWHIHDYLSTRPLMSRLLHVFHKTCTVAIVNSRSVAADVRSLFAGLRIAPIYNAVDLERFSPLKKKLDLDAMTGLCPAAPGTVRVGLVATFARWKGHKVFLQALARLASDTLVRGYVIGGPIYQTDSQWSLMELQQEAERLGLADKVGFTGFVENTEAAMRSLDIVVHASTKPEPFGMVIVEAMACGRSIIVSKAGGAAELFEEERTGLGHPPGDVTVLAAQMARLVNDPSLRARLGNAARAAAVISFHGSRLAYEVTRLYRECHAEVCNSPVLLPSFKS